VAAAGDRLAVLGIKLQQAGDALSAQKAVAVVASTAALAGGTVAHDRAAHHQQRHRAAAARVEADATPPSNTVPTPLPAFTGTEPPAAAAQPASPSKPSEEDESTTKVPASDAGPAAEFELEAAAPAQRPEAVEHPVTPPAVRAAATPRTTPQRSRAPPAGTQEFGP
jgi:hypothetical protein